MKSLVINRFGGVGLLLEGTGGNRVVGNRIGTDLSGTQAAGNGDGIQIQIVAGNTVGGLTRAERNIISGNRSVGINLAGPGSVFNHVMGNYIGDRRYGAVVRSQLPGGGPPRQRPRI